MNDLNLGNGLSARYNPDASHDGADSDTLELHDHGDVRVTLTRDQIIKLIEYTNKMAERFS